MFYIYMYSTYICITIYYIIQKKSRIYEPNMQKTITNRERMWTVLVSVYIVRQNIVRWSTIMIYILRLNYGHLCAKALIRYGLNVFERNASDKSCKVSKKLFTDIQFDLGWRQSQIKVTSMFFFNETCYFYCRF